MTLYSECTYLCMTRTQNQQWILGKNSTRYAEYSSSTHACLHSSFSITFTSVPVQIILFSLASYDHLFSFFPSAFLSFEESVVTLSPPSPFLLSLSLFLTLSLSLSLSLCISPSLSASLPPLLLSLQIKSCTSNIDTFTPPSPSPPLTPHPNPQSPSQLLPLLPSDAKLFPI